MDNRGHWHESEQAAMDANRKFRDQFSNSPSQMPERPAISIEYGEMVQVVKADGETLHATFDAVEKNKVTLTPQDKPGVPLPYFELAESVQLARASGESVKAQVWDNRKGKLILRTLPV